MTTSSTGRVADRAGGEERPRPASGVSAGVSARLHAPPTLEVAVLTATLVEERHPRLAQVLAADPRHPWRRVLDTASLLRAAALDPARALVLAARERVVGLRGPGLTARVDPDLLALRHALRVHCVLTLTAAAGRAPTRGEAERYVREQRTTAVLLGAEPDDLPASLAEVGADMDTVRRGARPAASTPSQTAGEEDALPGSWAQTSRLAVALLPSWVRSGPSPLSEQALVAALQHLGEAAPRG